MCTASVDSFCLEHGGIKSYVFKAKSIHDGLLLLNQIAFMPLNQHYIAPQGI